MDQGLSKSSEWINVAMYDDTGMRVFEYVIHNCPLAAYPAEDVYHPGHPVTMVKFDQLLVGVPHQGRMEISHA